MEYGIATLSIIPVHIKPGHSSELVTQLLFGDIYTIQETDENWMHILITADNYTGWIHKNQTSKITEQQYQNYLQASPFITAELVQTISSNAKSFPILMGSTLYDFDGMNFKLNKENFIYAGQAIQLNTNENRKSELVKKLALKFLNAPYLWGGKTAFGIDCSGFTQTVFKTAGIQLPRDAYQQAEIGKPIHFIFEAKEGDLVFFDDEEKKITHVGIYLQDNEVIHASGKVRIDAIDHQGIFNKELKKYTHTLRIIKRVL